MKKSTVPAFLVFIIPFLVFSSGCVREYDEPLKIAFLKFSSPGNLYIIDEDGGNEKQLTFHNNAKSPCFSPDGERILYIYNDTVDELHILNVEGVLLSGFPLPSGDCQNTAWSPEGRYIGVFDNANQKVNVYNLKGALVNSRQDGASFVGGMTFLSEYEIIIGRNGSSTADIWDFSNNTVRVFTLNIAGNNSFSALSANRKLYAWYYQGPPFFYIMDSATAQVIYSHGAGMERPAWAPDSRGLYYRGADTFLHYFRMSDFSSLQITGFPISSPTVQGMPR